MAKLKAIWARIPTAYQKFIRDAIEGAIAAVVALNLALPASTSEARAEGLTIAVAIAGAVIAVLRRQVVPYVLAQLAG